MSLNHVVFDCDGTLVDTSQLRYSLYPGIKELLSDLAKNSTLYVWTARDRKSTLRILKELGVLHYFNGISTIDDALPKPHISGLIELLGDTPRDKICMIGDTSNDILGAKNYGIKSIGAIWNSSSSASIMRELGADFVTNEPSTCLDWLNNNL